MRLLLIRHGDPDYPNDSLTEKGRAQARRLGEILRPRTLDHILVSPLGRARLTAEYIAGPKKMTPTVLPWLSELDGNYHGRAWAWNYPGSDTFEHRDNFTMEDWHRHVPYGAHMVGLAATFWEQFDAFLAERGYAREGGRYRVVRPGGQTLAFVCHAGIIQTLLSHLLHIPLPITYAQFAVGPGSCTTLDFEEKNGFGVFRLTGLNCTW
ncbi:MAG: histidine phosphatase family protein [Kiritimatiellaeota bacterium]|nr:histidine phosphatase family protein [Kiritimatiellota bacterium]